MQVFVHAVVAFYYIERAKDKLQIAGPYLLWERPHKMVKILVLSEHSLICLDITTLSVNERNCLLMLSYLNEPACIDVSVHIRQ